MERRSLKKSGLQWDSNPWPPRYRCDAHGFESRWSPDFFRLLLSNCLNWKINCDDHSSLSLIHIVACVLRENLSNWSSGVQISRDMNSPRRLIFPTAIKGVLITGVNEVDPGVIGTVSCISYLCLCWRKPKWALTIDSPFIRSCISVFAVTSSGKCTWWPAKIQHYVR